MLKKKDKKHIVIGLTGGIASGKSTASAFFKRMGCKIVDADAVAHKIVQPGMPALKAIANYFGSDILLPNGELNRPKLAALIFSDKNAQKALNQITHPLILAAMQAKTQNLVQNGAKIIIWDVPLLFETGFNNYTHASVLIDTNEELQLQRLMLRNGLSRDEALARVAAQMPLQQKRELATMTITNNGTIEELEKRANLVLDKLTKHIKD